MSWRLGSVNRIGGNQPESGIIGGGPADLFRLYRGKSKSCRVGKRGKVRSLGRLEDWGPGLGDSAAYTRYACSGGFGDGEWMGAHTDASETRRVSTTAGWIQTGLSLCSSVNAISQRHNTPLAWGGGDKASA